MILYHGSNVEITEIDLSLSKQFKDFGRGFYLTSLLDQAEKMARRTAKFYGGSPIVTAFEAPDSLLDTPYLSVEVFEKPTEDWAIFIINNRNRRFEDVSSPLCNSDCKYDIVYGPVGNDDITVLLRQFTRDYVDATEVSIPRQSRGLSFGPRRARYQGGDCRSGSGGRYLRLLKGARPVTRTCCPPPAS